MMMMMTTTMLNMIMDYCSSGNWSVFVIMSADGVLARKTASQ